MGDAREQARALFVEVWGYEPGPAIEPATTLRLAVTRAPDNRCAGVASSGGRCFHRPRAGRRMCFVHRSQEGDDG